MSDLTARVALWQLSKSRQILIEKVARAICWEDGRDPDREWHSFVRHATAAIGLVESARESAS